MNGLVYFVLCAIIGGSFGYNIRREAPYNEGPNNYNLDYVNYQSEPSQRLFWGNQGSNQVGGPGLWGTLTNKFPFLGTMFGKMELPNQYPNQALAAQYGTPNQYPTLAQHIPPERYQAQFHQAQQYNQQPVFRQGFPSGREVALTDDAVIVTPPFVPAAGVAPAPLPPVPQPPQIPITAPSLVQPPQNQFSGYSYDKPHYRLELPLK